MVKIKIGDNKKKVLVIGPSPTRSKGGMATVIKDLKDDKELNDKVEIDVYESFIDGIFLKRVLYSVYAYVRFCITKRGYDVYHIHAASKGSTFRKRYYVKAIKKWKKKLIFHVHGAQYMEFYRRCSAKQKKKVLKILQSADIVIALSEEWKKKFNQELGITNCVSLPNGIDTKKYATALCSVEDNKNNFLFLGRLGERKGAYDLVNAVELAAKYNSSIKIFMAGDGEVEKVKELVERKKLENNVSIVGWVDFNKKIELLKKSATLILPSYNEGLPMAILEAMASGKVIISTTVGAIPEVIQEKNGILVKPGDVEALADAIVKCSINSKMISLISKNNIKKIDDEYSMKIMHEKLVKYYKD